MNLDNFKPAIVYTNCIINFRLEFLQRLDIAPAYARNAS
jgi:hypothetical protein